MSRNQRIDHVVFGLVVSALTLTIGSLFFISAWSASGPVYPISATKQVQIDYDPPARIRTEIIQRRTLSEAMVPLDGATVSGEFTSTLMVDANWWVCCKSYKYAPDGSIVADVPHNDSWRTGAASAGDSVTIDSRELPDGDYEFYVSPTDGSGSVYVVFTVDNTPDTSPPVTDVTDPPNSLPVTSAIVSWTHDGANTDGYNVYYRPDIVVGDALSVLGIVKTQREIQIDNLYPANWEFWATAYNASGESAPSNRAYKLIPEPIPLPDPDPDPVPDPEPGPCDLQCWLDKYPEWTYIGTHTSVIRSEVEPEYYYVLYQDAERDISACIRFTRDEAESNLDMPTNVRLGPLALFAAQWGVGEPSEHDAVYCDPATTGFPVYEGPTWVVADNYWSDTRPMYEWVDGERGSKLKARVAEWTECEDNTLRTSTRSGGRDREYRFTTNVDGVRGATLCWEQLPDDPVLTSITGGLN